MSNRAIVSELSPQLTLEAVRAILDAVGPALLLVDDDCRPIFINRRAALILAQRDGLTLGPNGLMTDSLKVTRSLRGAIARVAAHAHSLQAHSRTLRLSVARRHPHPPWLLSILPIAPDGAGGVPARYAAIAILECEGHTRIDPSSAADYFLLTPREAEVAALLAAGRNSREAARAMHIGIGTVRTHLKSLFDKTGARSQTALALKLQAFAIFD